MQRPFAGQQVGPFYIHTTQTMSNIIGNYVIYALVGAAYVDVEFLQSYVRRIDSRAR